MKFIAVMALACLASMVVGADSPSLYDIPLKDIDGNDTSLKPFRGKVLLIVNVASQCGNTPQYGPLESLYKRTKDKGFAVLGFPCDDFGHQEPGSGREIKEFCTSNYQVTFPMFEKIHVKGGEQHPLYAKLSGKGSPFPGDVQWNFGKFLVSRDGRIIKRFEPDVSPDDPELVAAVDKAVAAK